MEDISLNVLDIAENSVRAKATLIGIKIHENRQEDYLSISISDNGCGMSSEQVNAVTDPFYTTRTTRKVGLGVPFFKMAAEMSGGSFRINSVLNEGTAVRADFGLSHVDRMPLGDMPATMVTLIQCNPEIDFLYTHQLDEEDFVLDTREIREILEGVPLNEPKVAIFLKSYLDEQISRLYQDNPDISPT